MGKSTYKRADDYWIRADPVHLHIERDQIVLADSRVFPISPDEADQLTGLLNRHFSANEMAFLPLRPDRWYLRVIKTPPGQTHLLSDVVNRGINERLPFGANNTIWRGFFNEIQMLLHEHPLNQSREARGEPAINGAWFWGEESCRNRWGPLTLTYGATMFLPCLSRLPPAQTHAPLPLNATILGTSSTSGNHLVVLDALQGTAQYRDAYGWRESLKALDHDWFEPLWGMFRQGQVDQVTLTTHATIREP